MSQKTALVALKNRAAVHKFPISKFLHQYTDDTVHGEYIIELSFDQLLEPIHQPYNSTIRNIGSPIENTPSPPPSIIDKYPSHYPSHMNKPPLNLSSR